MRMLSFAITCGEETCAEKPGKFCQFVRTSHFGKRWSCLIFEENLKEDKPKGWLMRCKKCLECDETPPLQPRQASR